jgi:hypothetical protein
VQKWYQNKYTQAAGIALLTGVISALTIYVTTMTDGLDLRHTIKDVGIAFLAPFSLLLSVMPKITDILTPTVRIEGGNGMAVHEVEVEKAVADNAVVTSQPVTTVVVGPRPRLRKNPNADAVPIVQTEANKGTIT